MSWLQPGSDGHELRFSTWHGRGWTESRAVATGPDFFVNWADFPSVVPGPGNLRLAHWLQSHPGNAYSYDVRIVASTDAGRAWSEPIVPHEDGTATEHGFVSLLRDRDAWLAIWLDGRETGSATRDAADAAAHGLGIWACATRASTTREPCSVSRSCSTRESATAARLAPHSRRRVRSSSIATAPRRRSATFRSCISANTTGLSRNACTTTGGRPQRARSRAAVAARDRLVAVAWFTAPDQPRVRLAFSSDSGQTFAAPIEVASGRVTGRVDVALLEDGRAAVSWLDELSSAHARILVNVFDRHGAAGVAVVVAETSVQRAAGFPRMARVGDRLLFAWTEPGEPAAIRTAVARLR